MWVLGTFRDLDRPDRFVWLRGFDDMASRREGLTAFYGGPVWQKHRNAANDTMLDSDNVLLLRDAREGSGFAFGQQPRPPKGATEIPPGLLVATVYSLVEPVGPELVDSFDRVMRPELAAAGVAVLATYVTEATANDYPRLAVRENEHTFVWFAAFADPAAHARAMKSLAESARWREVAAELKAKLKEPPEVLRLQPTPRSLLPSNEDLPAGPSEAGRRSTAPRRS